MYAILQNYILSHVRYDLNGIPGHFGPKTVRTYNLVPKCLGFGHSVEVSWVRLVLTR